MGYDEAPWIFKGRALFQLQLVKVEEARKYVPESLKLVSAFGYTLGGFFLSRYSGSPVGPMDEFVALSGLVWDFPFSCAWAARVYVNDRDARNHGLQVIGLPSRIAHFQEEGPLLTAGAPRDWWSSVTTYDCSGQSDLYVAIQPRKGTEGDKEGSGNPAVSGTESTERALVLHNRESGPWWHRRHVGHRRGLSHPVCRLVLPPAPAGWPGPSMRILLPSFSGSTPDCPAILKYTCVLRTNVAPIRPARCHAYCEDESERSEVLTSILNGKPLIALSFSNMVMSVDEAVVHDPKRARGTEQKSALVTAWCSSAFGRSAARRRSQRLA